jgi:high affinity Mn2+ porin
MVSSRPTGGAVDVPALTELAQQARPTVSAPKSPMTDDEVRWVDPNNCALPGLMLHCMPTAMSRARGRTLRSLAISVLLCGPVPDSLAAEEPDERFAIHGQFTYVEQETDSFAAPYSGPNSLSPNSGRETVDATLFIGSRLWPGAEGWIVPEIDQGFGLDDTLGIAGFPSGTAYKVGKNPPYLRLQRAFVRQTVGLGGSAETVGAAADQLGGTRSADRWVFTVGKFGVTDIFDTNQYAHDPRSDFLNWSVIDAGSFDYAADSWGFTVGAAAERYQGSWTLRVGVFDLSNIPNSPHLEPGFHEFQIDAEIEKRYELFGQTGRILVTGFDSRARMGLLDEAVALAQATGTTPNPASVRQFRSRLGASLDLEQPLSADLGVFARVGKAAGNVEIYEFTDIDRSIQVGAALDGRRWHRSGDTIGVALVDNGISAEREQYLNAGGLGILIGDGRLPHPGAEQIIETYYSFEARSWAHLSLDYQWVENPAYNTDRGPVSIFAVRLHAQF